MRSPAVSKCSALNSPSNWVNAPHYCEMWTLQKLSLQAGIFQKDASLEILAEWDCREGDREIITIDSRSNDVITATEQSYQGTAMSLDCCTNLPLHRKRNLNFSSGLPPRQLRTAQNMHRDVKSVHFASVEHVGCQQHQFAKASQETTKKHHKQHPAPTSAIDMVTFPGIPHDDNDE